MKSVYLTVFFCAFVALLESDQAQAKKVRKSFSGSITYNVIIESKDPLIDSKTLQGMFGTSMTLYIQGGNYKMVYNGSVVHSVLYVGKENKHYIDLGAEDSVLWRNTDRDDSRYLNFVFYPKADYVQGRLCNSMIIETDWGMSTYFYDRKIYLNPAGFQRQGIDYFNLYLRKAQSPFLKLIYDGPTFKKTLIATSINEGQLDPSIFTPVTVPVAAEIK